MSHHEFEHVDDPEVLKPEETEQLIKLWAQRQAESGRTSIHPNVQDMAEALGATPESVRTMLGDIRSPTEEPQRVVKSERRARIVLLSIIPLILTFGAVILYLDAQNNARHYHYPASDLGPPSTTAAMPSVNRQLELPKGMTATLDGATILGSGASLSLGSQEEWESVVSDALIAKTAIYFPVNGTLDYDAGGQVTRAVDALRHNEWSNLFKWADASIQYGGHSVGRKVPIQTIESKQLNEYILVEQQRRYRLLANELYMKLVLAKQVGR